MPIHVSCAEGEAQFWLEPTISCATQVGLTEKILGRIRRMVEEHEDEIRAAWEQRFQS